MALALALALVLALARQDSVARLWLAELKPARWFVLAAAEAQNPRLAGWGQHWSLLTDQAQLELAPIPQILQKWMTLGVEG